MDGATQTKYKCRKCRHLLFTEKFVYQARDGGATVRSPCSETTSMIFLVEEPLPDWLWDNIVQSGWTKGKINCPKCQGRIGSFDFITLKKCICGTLHQAVRIVRSRVDEIPTTPGRTAGNVVEESDVAPSGSARNYADCYGAENYTASSPNRISASEQSHDASVASLHDASVQSHDALVQSHDTSVQSHDALVQSHDATVQSQYAILQSHDATVQSHDASVQSHDALVTSVQSHDAVEQSHDASVQSHDATVQSHDASEQSHDALQGSQESYQRGGLGFRYNATLKIKNSSGLVFHGNMQSTSSLWQPSQQGPPQASNVEKETPLEQPLLDDSTRTESVMFDCGTNPSLRVSMIKDESNMPGASVAPPAGETHELWHLTVSSGYASSAPTFTQTIVTSGGDVSNYNREPPSGGAGNLSISSSGQISESNSVENVNLIHGNNDARIVPTPPGGDEENYSTLFPSDGEELLDEYGEDDVTFGRENDPVVERFIENSAVMTSTENRTGFLHDIAFLNSNGRGEQEEEDDESFTPPPVRSRRAKRRKKLLKTLKQQYQRFKTLPPAEDDLSINNSLGDSEDSEDMLLIPNVDGLTCSVCLDLFYRPHTCCPCDHVFCDPCLRQLARSHPINTKCPLCREVIQSCRPNHELTSQVRSYFPAEYKSRSKQEHKTPNNRFPLPKGGAFYRPVRELAERARQFSRQSTIIRHIGRERYISSLLYCCGCLLVFAILLVGGLMLLCVYLLLMLMQYMMNFASLIFQDYFPSLGILVLIGSRFDEAAMANYFIVGCAVTYAIYSVAKWQQNRNRRNRQRVY